MKLPLKGIIPPMITPLLENKELDSQGLKLLIEHLIEGGVHGIFLLGTNGEGPSLDYNLRKQLIKEACEIVNDRILVLVGITDTSFKATVEIANYSKEMGVDALVVAPPYYFPVTQQETIDYLKALVPMLPLPFLLYNIPSCTKVNLSVETVKKGKELGAIGVKDSSGDMSLLYALIDEFKDSPDFSVIAGAELFLTDTILNGGQGAVAGGANCFPKLFVALYEASLSRDLKKMAFLRNQLLHVHKTIYNVGDSPTKSIQAIKCVLSLQGICKDYMALPLSPLNSKHRKEIKTYLEEFDYSNSKSPV